MLAKTADEKKLARRTTYLKEEKADGLRLDLYCEAPGVVVPYARSGKTEPYRANLVHLCKAAAEILKPGECITGECILDNDWNATMSLVRRKHMQPGDEAKLLKVQLRCFDFVDYNALRGTVYEVAQTVRRARLEALVAQTDDRLIMMTQEEITLDQIPEKLAEALDEGWEGIMLKDPNAYYRCDYRSDAWLKIKPRGDIDGKIVGFQAGQDGFTGTLGALLLEGVGEAEGLSWKVGTGFLLDDTEGRGRHWFWANKDKLRGKIVECFCQQEKKKVASVRFPVFHRLRTDR
jgi:ATP-dependent DNA ligase